MSSHTPGSKDWWVETGLIALGGVLLAVWLWPAPSPQDEPIQEEATGVGSPYLAHEPRRLADMMTEGCLTADHLRQLRDGAPLTITTCNGAPITPWTTDPQ